MPRYARDVLWFYLPMLRRRGDYRKDAEGSAEALNPTREGACAPREALSPDCHKRVRFST